MSESITIYHAAEEIGGNAIEISSGDTRIVFDLGLPLTGGLLRPLSFSIPGVNAAGKRAAALIFSHAHLDHIGQCGDVHPDVPMYATAGTRRLLPVIGRFVDRRFGGLWKRMRVLPLNDTLTIGPFRITAWPVDHSAYGAAAFLIEVNGKNVFYSGDLRAHGRKPGMWTRLLKNLALQPIDLMLLEGTCLGSERQELSEQIVAIDAARLMRKTAGIVLLQFSPLNVDRLVSFIHACKDSGRQLIIDAYTACLLHMIAARPGKRRTEGQALLPPWQSDRYRIFRYVRLAPPFRAVANDPAIHARTIKSEEINANRGRFAMLVRPSAVGDPDFERIDLTAGALVYSQWAGYRKEKSQQDFEAMLTSRSLASIQMIHASGHIYASDMRELIAKARPRLLTPIHTTHAEQYAELYISERVRRLRNGETMSF